MNSVITAIIGIVGVLIGSLISYFTNKSLKKKEVELRILEKVFDKRIAAHESILKVSQMLRTTHQTFKVDKESNAITYPAILDSPKSVDDFVFLFWEVTNFNSHWLDIELFRELNYIQDYMSTLINYLIGVPAEKYKEVGIIIKEDIINLAAELEKTTNKFFEIDIYSVRIQTSKGHHKISREETERRVQNTQLLKKYSIIQEMRR
jgi:hypothetical protein